MPTLNTTSEALKFFLSSPAKENNKEKENAPTVKPSLTEEGVEIERLQAEVKALTAKLAVTEDLEKQVTSLQAQVKMANEKNETMQAAFKQALMALRTENNLLTE